MGEGLSHLLKTLQGAPLPRQGPGQTFFSQVPGGVAECMPKKGHVGFKEVSRQAGPDWLQCVRGERVQSKEEGSHIFLRLFRALHSLGSVPVRRSCPKDLVVWRNAQEGAPG